MGCYYLCIELKLIFISKQKTERETGIFYPKG